MAKKARTARAVIGAGYGDEGKGLMTDWLASQGADVVVRTNGGAQAGHTVENGGSRHVFHHFPSGSAAGVPGHLSRHFVSHPMLFGGERAELLAKGWSTRLTADPRGLVTTPWDMMVNQFIEVRRGNARHGSCGVGFGETIERSLRDRFLISVGDVLSGADVRGRLLAIRNDWVPERLKALGGGELSPEEASLVSDDGILEAYLADCEAFAASVTVLEDRALRGAVLFEGAQGLMLDQEYGSFPHVTRSYTGVRNMSEVAAEAGIGKIEALYATRAYVTRHGAGPLGHEGEPMDHVRIVDPTNAPNEWQGTIRAAPLDVDVLAAAIARDLAQARMGVKASASLAVTCVDQVHGSLLLWSGGKRERVPAEMLACRIGSLAGYGVEAVSRGPSRGDVSSAGTVARAA
mgnify:CR=1 FL=1